MTTQDEADPEDVTISDADAMEVLAAGCKTGGWVGAACCVPKDPFDPRWSY